MYSEIHPVMSSPVTHHALFQNVFHTELNVAHSYECLLVCHLEPKCKSFNFSPSLKTCDLNSATRGDFPARFVYHKNYDYYHMESGVITAAKQDL